MRKNKPESNNRIDQSWWFALAVISILSCATRFYKISQPDHVCWDETHFGKMGGWYINRKFFFDVHPPLGKMLIGLSGYLTGYDGSFSFEKPGIKFGNVSYVGMRAFCAAVGTLIAPLGYLTVWELTGSLDAAIFASLFLLLDVGVLTISRFILLDPLLLCSMMATAFGIAKFRSFFRKPFSSQWWTWLVFTGVAMTCCMCVKFVGLFTVIFVGLLTIEELWIILGDLEKTFMNTIKHLFARIIGLIIVPIVTYMLFFYIHLQVLNHSGDGDGFFSSAFQSRLIGNSLHDANMPREVAYNAIITLKNHRIGGAYLHSHPHLYPEGVGARQQQITTYPHKDSNNHWKVKPYDKELPENSSVVLLKHGDLVRLEHVLTGRNLHSHKESAPITTRHFQATAYGQNGIGDDNDVWQVFIENGIEGEVATVITSKLKFIHRERNCILTTTGAKLPKWGYEQNEVTCNQDLNDKNALWNVEENIFSELPNTSFQAYTPSFLEQFTESHAVMFKGNSDLKPKEGEETSKPWHWPINLRGLLFSGENFRILLLGNPIIWWSNLVFLGVLFPVIFLYNAFRYQRGYRDATDIGKARERIVKSCFWLFVSWVVHYVPFWCMGRVLYYHHYFPALLFNSMLSGAILGYILESVKQIFSERIGYTINHLLKGFVFSSVIYSFYLFAPLTYGMSGALARDSSSAMHGLLWLETWDF